MPKRKRPAKSENKENVDKKAKAETKKSVKLSVFDKKVAEFKELACESPDTMKLISDNTLTIGAHVSVAKGIYNGLINAFKIKATSMAFFVTQPRKWTLQKGLLIFVFKGGTKLCLKGVL